MRKISADKTNGIKKSCLDRTANPKNSPTK